MAQLISSSLVSAANKIVSLNRGSASMQSTQSNYQEFLRFMDVETQNLKSIKFNKKKLRQAYNANVESTFGNAGSLLGGLLSGALDIGGFVGDFFGGGKKNKGKVLRAEEDIAKGELKALPKGERIRIPGIKGIPLVSALLTGLDFAERKSEGQTNLQAGVGAGGALAGSILAGIVAAPLEAVPGVGFLLHGAAIAGGGMLGGAIADKLTGAGQPTAKEKAQIKLKTLEQQQRAKGAAIGAITFQEVLDKFDNVVIRFERSIQNIASPAYDSGVSQWDTGETEADKIDYRPKDAEEFKPTGTGDEVFPLVGGRPTFTEGAGTFNASRDGGRRRHSAQDIGVDPNTTVVASRSGKVLESYSSGYGAVGGAVVIRYDNGQQGLYGHVLPNVKVGDKVDAGQKIARVAPDGGNTHLHYMRKDTRGNYIDPLPILRQSKSGVATVKPDKKESKKDLKQQSQFKGDTGDQSQKEIKKDVQQQLGQATTKPKVQGAAVATTQMMSQQPKKQQMVQSQDQAITPEVLSEPQVVAVPQSITNIQQIQEVQQYPSYILPQSSVTLIPILQDSGNKTPMIISSGSASGGGGQTVVMPGPTEGEVLNSLMKSILLTSLSAT